MAPSILCNTSSLIFVGLPDFGRGTIVPYVLICRSKRQTVWRHVIIPSLLRVRTMSLQLEPPDNSCRILSLAYDESLGRDSHDRDIFKRRTDQDALVYVFVLPAKITSYVRTYYIVASKPGLLPQFLTQLRAPTIKCVGGKTEAEASKPGLLPQFLTQLRAPTIKCVGGKTEGEGLDDFRT